MKLIVVLLALVQFGPRAPLTPAETLIEPERRRMVGLQELPVPTAASALVETSPLRQARKLGAERKPERSEQARAYRESSTRRRPAQVLAEES